MTAKAGICWINGMATRKILLSLVILGAMTGALRAQSAPPGADEMPPGPLYDSADDFDRLEDGAPPPPANAAIPLGPVMSPDDPRYGRRLPSPPPQASQQGDASPPPRAGFIYPDANQAPGGGNAAINRPPGVVGTPQNAQPGQANLPEGQPSPTTGASVAILPPEDQPETGTPKELPAHLKRQEVDFVTKEPAGTIVVDTANTHLYYVLGNGRAVRYGIRVGRDGFRWTGTEKITRKVEWPDWYPPAEMIERQPYLPRFMAGGSGNPLGARAMYLGHTVYRIHGTNQPSTIGKTVSSGCFGLLNEDVEDLFSRVKVGTRVVVLEGEKKTFASGPPVSLAAPNAPAGTPQNGSAPQGPPAANVAPSFAAQDGAVSAAPLPPPGAAPRQ